MTLGERISAHESSKKEYITSKVASNSPLISGSDRCTLRWTIDSLPDLLAIGQYERDVPLRHGVWAGDRFIKQGRRGRRGGIIDISECGHRNRNIDSSDNEGKNVDEESEWWYGSESMEASERTGVMNV
jgi:hypothetical protein